MLHNALLVPAAAALFLSAPGCEFYDTLAAYDPGPSTTVTSHTTTHTRSVYERQERRASTYGRPRTGYTEPPRHDLHDHPSDRHSDHGYDNRSRSSRRGYGRSISGYQSHGHYDAIVEDHGHIQLRAPANGIVTVENVTRGYQVVRRSVRRGERIDVWPNRDKIESNGESFYHQNLEKDDVHAILFVEGARGGARPYAGIPSDAWNAASGYGHISARAPRDGVMWVGNDKLKTLVIGGEVRRNDLIEVDAKRDEVKINGRVVWSRNLESKHSHSIFLR